MSYRTLLSATAEREDPQVMPDDLAGEEPVRAALASPEADRRKTVLARLQDALTAQGLESVLVGRQVLALRGRGPVLPSRCDPQLHVLGPGQCHVVTTDGCHYRFADGSSHPADDPGGAAGCVLSADIGPGRIDPVHAERADGLTAGAGERALRRLRDTGVI